MNHKMKLKIGLISALLLGQSLASAANPTPNPAPVELQPIRMARGVVQIDRFDTTWNAAKNDINLKVTPVCKQHYDIPVFDVRNVPNYYYSVPNMVVCKDIVGTEVVEFNAGSSFSIFNGKSISIPQDLKMYSGFAYLNDNGKVSPQLPYIRNQDSFSVDINQVNFGLISMAPAGALCMAESGPIESTPVPGPSPRPMMKQSLKSTDPTKCTIMYPVAYQAIWTAEDQP